MFRRLSKVRPLLLLTFLALMAPVVSGCARGEAPEAAAEDEADRPPLVFAAASLADAMTDVGAAWGQVDFSFAGSNDLARQIAAGAPADLFVSADRERLEAAAASSDRTGVDLDRAVPLLGNELVVIVPASAEGVPEISSAGDLLAFARIGLADPEAVPAGVYARRWLEAAGAWSEIRSRVVPALDVRANLAAVASGAVPVGIVYATDAATGVMAARVRVVHRVGAGEGVPPIVYWAAPVTDRGDGFLRFLRGPEAGDVFRFFGFRHLPTEGTGGEGDG